AADRAASTRGFQAGCDTTHRQFVARSRARQSLPAVRDPGLSAGVDGMRKLLFTRARAFSLALALVASSCAGVPSLAANCSSNPFTLTNGQTADATQVMANFNNLLNC